MTMPKGLNPQQQSEWHDHRRAKNREVYWKRKDYYLQKAKEYREANPEKVAEAKKRVYLRDPEAMRRKVAKWVSENPEKRKAQLKRHEAKASFKVVRQARQKHRIATDPVYALKRRLRCGTAFAFKRSGYRKPGNTEKILGAAWGVVAAHIESQFRDGMTWDNRGVSGWHVDHIIPLASAETPEELLKLCHYTNLQPLWHHENMRKGAKMPCGRDVRRKAIKS